MYTWTHVVSTCFTKWKKYAAATLKKNQNKFDFDAVLHQQIYFMFVLSLEAAIHTRAAIRSAICSDISCSDISGFTRCIENK